MRPSGHLFALFLLACALLLPSGAQALHIEAEEHIVDLLRPWLEEGSGERQIQQLSRELLATEGYFSPKFELTVGDEALQLKIDPGPRTLIEQVDVTVDGPLPSSRREALLADWKLPKGAPFRQEDWNNAKQAVLADLLAEDFPTASLSESSAEIDPENQQASLHAHYQSGPPYVFGELQFSGLQRYHPDLIARYNRSVQTGQPYRAEALHELQAALQGTPYFASARIDIDRDWPADADGTVRSPVRVQLNERQPHRIGFGAGASSNTGARVELNYHSADLFRRAWELSSGLRIEQKQQTIYSDVFLPPDLSNRRISVGAMGERSDIQGLQTERVAFGVQEIHQTEALETRYTLNWENEQLNPEGLPGSRARALVPGVSWSWRQVDSQLDPRRGIVLQGQLNGASQSLLSERDFARAYGRYQQFIPLDHSTVLSLRGELGYTWAASRLDIPQSYLFRAGGTGSVRGYAYRSLGLHEGNAVLGGRYLATGSVELTHWLDEQWGIAGFVDSGDAIDNLNNIKAAIGYGIGARWRSPAGPLGIDLARGERTGQLHIHFALAIPL